MPRSRRIGGGVLQLPVAMANRECWVLLLGSRLDFERCIAMGLWEYGCCWFNTSCDKFPVEVAAFIRLTSGFSGCGQGRGIFESQGISDDGGAIVGLPTVPGRDMIPIAT